MLRGAVAFLVAPLWAPLVVGLMTMGAISPLPGSISVLAATIAAAFAYPLALLVGLPVYVLMMRRHWTGFWSASTVGALLGGVSAYMALVLLKVSRGGPFATVSALDPTDALDLIGAGVVIGLLAGSTMWVIVRPDRVA